MQARTRNNPPEFTSRRGAMMILIAILLIVFLIAAAFSIDVAYMQLTRTELRAAADASAKAGAEALARTQDPAKARAAAIRVAAMNKVAGDPLRLTDDDVKFGRSTQQDDGSWQFVEGAEPVNAVRVSAEKIEGKAGPVSLFFGKMFGREHFEPTKAATASYLDQELCLVIDRSHSMCFDLSGVSWQYPPGTPMNPHPIIYKPHPTQSRWGTLRQAVKVFVQIVRNSRTQPRMALVTWGSEIPASDYWAQMVGMSFPAVERDIPLGANYPGIMGVINRRTDLPMMGGTNMSAGVDEGRAVLTAPNVRPLAKKIMILMTDGQWNQGRDPIEAARDAAAKDIVVHTVTFLRNADQGTMQEIARITGGRHYHADDAAELEAAFRELALSLPVVLTE